MEEVSASWNSVTKGVWNIVLSPGDGVGTLSAGSDLPVTLPQALVAIFLLVLWKSLLT